MISLLDYIAFGEHGPRTPVVQPGEHTKVAGGVLAVLTTAATLFYILDSNGMFFCTIKVARHHSSYSSYRFREAYY